MGKDLTFYADGIVRYKPISITPAGAPCYGPEGMTVLGVKDHGDLIPVERDGVLLVLSGTGYGETSYLRALQLDTWKELWRYTSYSHGVHGSHHATMPEPGKVIGALKICGVAELEGQAGSVFCIRGNLGEDYLISTDGFFVGSLFRDSRLPGPSLPPREEDLAGKYIQDQTEGGEPFNGWFGRQSDGKVRICTGIPGQAAMVAEVEGLEGIRRFKGPAVKIEQAQLVQAEQENALRAAARTARKACTIRRMATPPKVDGDARDWGNAPAEEIARAGFPDRGQFRLAYDAERLYVFFQVEESTPWRNQGKEFARLFKTGDAVDLQFCMDPASLESKDVGAAHVRLLFAPWEGKPACVLMKPVAPGTPAEKSYDYRSPTGTRRFERVEVLEAASVAVRVEKGRYCVEAAVLWSALGGAPQAGKKIRGDAGFISSDEAGTINSARTYWSSTATNLTNDLPSEAWLQPGAWGEWRFE
jgi:hypothetical protein